MPVCLINSEQIVISEQLCDDQKDPYYQVWLLHENINKVWKLSYFTKCTNNSKSISQKQK